MQKFFFPSAKEARTDTYTGTFGTQTDFTLCISMRRFFFFNKQRESGTGTGTNTWRFKLLKHSFLTYETYERNWYRYRYRCMEIEINYALFS
jgi:hypothetical protein